MQSKRIQFCDADESPLPPPVPPRRKKSKVKSKQPITTSSEAKVEQKQRPPPPLPPPTAPQRIRIGRKTPSPLPTQNITPELSNVLSSIESFSDNQSKVSKNDFPESKYMETNISEARKKNSKTLNKNALESDKIQTSQCNTQFSLSNESNKYPPLYFTFQDYQTVMEGSSSLKNENNDKLVDQVNDTKQPTTEPFKENIIFHNEREEIYFRVTTTDRPFEKCLREWTKDYDEGVQEFKEEQQPDFYIFEDYIDRSKKLNAKPHLLFTEDFFSIPQDDNSASTERSTTRVRFLIESPSTSTPDLDFDDDNERSSYGNFIDKQFENREKSSIQLFEITDEELQSTDDNTNEAASEINTESKMELEESAEDEIISECLYGLTNNQTNDSYSDWEEDIEVYAFTTNSEINTKSLFFQKNSTQPESKEEGDEKFNLQKEFNELLNEKEKKIDSNESQKPSEMSTEILTASLFHNLPNNIGSKLDVIKADSIQVDNNIQLVIPKIIEPTNNIDDDVKEYVDDIERHNKNKNVDLQVDKKSSVPVYKRRSTFLETMLNEIDAKSEKSIMLNCEVIEAHLKQASNLLTEQENVKSSKDSMIITTELEKVQKDNSQVNITESKLQSKAPKIININTNNTKSAGDVKGDVLNELLTNFNTIKLKPVNKNTRESIRTHELKSERKDENKLVDTKTDIIREIRGELDATECKDEKKIKVELNSEEIIQNLLKEEKHRANASINKNVRAIVTEAPYIQRIENDNKTTTPVIVSKDQYREAVSITPGSVRSFVKYYEIHTEISNISKIKDNAFKKQKNEFSLQREKMKAGKKSTKVIDKNKKTSNNTTLKAEIKGKEKEKISCQSSKVLLQHLSPSTISKPFIQKQSCMKSSIPSPKPERKKSVQFDNDHTIISPHKKEKDKGKEKEEEGTFSSFIGGIRTRLKGKAPAKPEVKRAEQSKVSKQGQWRNENAEIFCIQKSPEAKTVACTAKPGNIGFLPQTETLQSNQTIVFYCTV